MRTLVFIAAICLAGFVVFKQREAVVRLTKERDEAVEQLEEAKRMIAEARGRQAAQPFVPQSSALQSPAAPPTATPEQGGSWMWDSKKTMSTLDDR